MDFESVLEGELSLEFGKKSFLLQRIFTFNHLIINKTIILL